MMTNTRSARLTLLLVIALAGPGIAVHQGQRPSNPQHPLREEYLKQEYQIPMRDGVRLFASVYAPRETSEKYPIVLLRTPYSVRPYGEEQYTEQMDPDHPLVKEGYIFVFQDVRGRYMSEGEFVNMRPHVAAKEDKRHVDESTDTYDTIEWLIRNIPNNNGRAGLWGISYPGFYAAAGTIDSHPALKAASPQAPIADWFIGDDFHHNGAFFLMDAFNFFSGFGRPRRGLTTTSSPSFTYQTRDAYAFFLELGPLRNVNLKVLHDEIPFWNDLMRHDTYDEFWQSRNLLPHLSKVTTAVMTVGGWFDAEDLYGPLHIYQSLEQKNPGVFNVLVMGPWSHGGWSRSEGDRLGDIRFDSTTARYYRENIELPFFNYFLKDKGTLRLPEATIFMTGSNQWRTFDRWPPAGATKETLFLHQGERLSFMSPADSIEPAFDEYLSDPYKPVPYTSRISENRGIEYMIEDQRFAARRPDVLVYQSNPLAEDLSLTGPISANLFISSTGTDADFIVKLIDVYPGDAPDISPNSCQTPMGGFQMLVRAEVMRARFRESFEKPIALVPGQISPVSFALQDVGHTFKKGHRIMVHIQSSWFPLVDRNPQTFVDISDATEADFQDAKHRIYRSGRFASNLTVHVLREPTRKN